MKPICTICDAPWLPSCSEHPITIPYAPLARAATAIRAAHQRRASAAVADALARDASLAGRYGLEREP